MNGVGAHAMGKKNRGGEGKADKWGPLVSVSGGEQVSGPELGCLREVLGWGRNEPSGVVLCRPVWAGQETGFWAR